jgi:uncharacterized membrane protein YeiH
MLQSLIIALDWFGICVFAVSGALVASRKQMDIVGFAMMGSVTGIGGGTIRDVLLGVQPVFWVAQPTYLLACVVVACATFFLAHIPQHRYRYLLWFDAVGLALFAVTGAGGALSHGASPSIAVAMGVATATFGGIIRDILGGESPVILSQEIYITAALAGAAAFVALMGVGASQDLAVVLGFAAGFGLRAAALYWGLTLPRYKPKPAAGTEEEESPLEGSEGTGGSDQGAAVLTISACASAAPREHSAYYIAPATTPLRTARCWP